MNALGRSTRPLTGSARAAPESHARPGANGVVAISPFEFSHRPADLVPPPLTDQQPLAEVQSTVLASAARDPPHRLLGEAVQRPDGQIEMLQARVLDLVVTDAREALHEEHHRGHPRHRHLGGVVERA